MYRTFIPDQTMASISIFKDSPNKLAKKFSTFPFTSLFGFFRHFFFLLLCFIWLLSADVTYTKSLREILIRNETHLSTSNAPNTWFTLHQIPSGKWSTYVRIYGTFSSIILGALYSMSLKVWRIPLSLSLCLSVYDDNQPSK